MLNPASPKSDAIEEVPNLHFLDKRLRKFLSEKGMFPLDNPVIVDHIKFQPTPNF